MSKVVHDLPPSVERAVLSNGNSVAPSPPRT
jgi:hypothetical protein